MPWTNLLELSEIDAPIVQAPMAGVSTPVGRVVDIADGRIAAVAAVQDAVLVTANVGHFEVFEGLRVENWLA